MNGGGVTNNNLEKSQNRVKSQNRRKGQIGEVVAVGFLVKQGFSIIERNYLKKWGEIDIVAQKGKTLHFIEVKSMWGRTLAADHHNPAENVHFRKKTRLARTIQTYLIERHIHPETPISIDVAIVTLDEVRRVGRVAFLENVLL